MQIFLNHLNGTQTIANLQDNESFEAFLLNNSLDGLRLVCQGSIVNADNA